MSDTPPPTPDSPWKAPREKTAREAKIVGPILAFLLAGAPVVTWRWSTAINGIPLWQAFVLTLPLTVAVTIVAFCILQRRRLTYFQIICIVLEPPFVTWWLGWSFGGNLSSVFTFADPPQCVSRPASAHDLLFGEASQLCTPGQRHLFPIWEWPGRIPQLFSVYWHVFGLAEILAALVAGIFLARVMRLWLAAFQAQQTLKRTSPPATPSSPSI